MADCLGLFLSDVQIIDISHSKNLGMLMNLIPEYLNIAFALQVKLQLTPLNIGALLALGFCMVVVWRWYKRRT